METREMLVYMPSSDATCVGYISDFRLDGGQEARARLIDFRERERERREAVTNSQPYICVYYIIFTDDLK